MRRAFQGRRLHDLAGVGLRAVVVVPAIVPHARLSAMEPMDCLVIYVPTSAAHAVRQAVGDAGAGSLGNYSHCSFSLEGTGRFTPLPGANPTVGVVNFPEEVPETRIEAIYPRSRRNAVVAAALSVHPYETPAFMTFPINASLPDGTGPAA